MTQTNTDNKTEERKNRFNGESIMLTKEESIIHDRIFINELAATLEDKAKQELTVRQSFGTKYVKTLTTFRQHNAEAYMVSTRLDANLSCPGANAPGHMIQVPWIPIQYQHCN